MSIENHIEQLTKAINSLTAVISKSIIKVNIGLESAKYNTKPKIWFDESTEEPKVAVEESNNIDESKHGTTAICLDESTDESNNIDVAKVKELARAKIQSGVNRDDIKSLVKKLGGESVSDLNQEALNIIYYQIEKLQN